MRFALMNHDKSFNDIEELLKLIAHHLNDILSKQAAATEMKMKIFSCVPNNGIYGHDFRRKF